MSEENTGHVFISHSSADKKFARSLAAQLKARDIPVWLDEEELLPGSNWQEAISRALRNASVIIVVVSENSVSSSWQNVEMGMAISLAAQSMPDQVRVIPIRLSRDDRAPELPSFLRMWNGLESDELNVDEVADSVAEAIKN